MNWNASLEYLRKLLIPHVLRMAFAWMGLRVGRQAVVGGDELPFAGDLHPDVG